MLSFFFFAHTGLLLRYNFVNAEPPISWKRLFLGSDSIRFELSKSVRRKANDEEDERETFSFSFSSNEGNLMRPHSEAFRNSNSEQISSKKEKKGFSKKRVLVLCLSALLSLSLSLPFFCFER